jgi:hypothetical protein
VQLVLPFGNATPNRTGPAARLTAHWRNAVFATVDLARFKEIEGGAVDGVAAPLTTFSRMGGGLKVEAAKLLGLALPLDFQASLVRNGAKRDRIAKDLGEPEVKADLLMAGFRWRFLPKWGVLGGFEQAKTSSLLRVIEKGVTDPAKTHVYQYQGEGTQKHYRAGVEYTVTRNAYLLLAGGLIDVDNTFANLGTAENAEGPIAARSSVPDFKQALTQAVIRVKF